MINAPQFEFKMEMPFSLIQETTEDGERISRERAQAEKDAEEAKAADAAQPALFVL